MKIAFFGTPEFAIKTFEKLLSSIHEILFVVTQRDKPKGRKKILSPPPVKILAQKNNIKVFQPEKVNSEEFIETYKRYNPDLNLIIAFGQIIPDEIIYAPRYTSINIHASLLPKYRGAAPINYALINGEKETGITYQFIEKRLDAGDIIYQKKMTIDIKDDGITLSEKLSSLAADTVCKVLDMVEKGNFKRIKQNENEATYAKILKKEDGKINFDDTTINVYNKIRGLLPWPVAYCKLDNKNLKIYKSDFFNELYDYKNITPGKIIDIIKNKGILVKTKDGNILLTEVQIEGGKRLPAYDFAIGYRNIKSKTLL